MWRRENRLHPLFQGNLDLRGRRTGGELVGGPGRVRAVVASSEAIEHGLVPASAAVRRKLKDGSTSLSALFRTCQTPVVGRSIEVPSTVRGEAGLGLAAVAAAGEVVKHGFSLGLRWANGKNGCQTQNQTDKAGALHRIILIGPGISEPGEMLVFGRI